VFCTTKARFLNLAVDSGSTSHLFDLQLQTMIRVANSLAVQGGRAPIQRLDLACWTTALLELPCMANQMCVIGLATQHPVQPHGQFASDGHFGHAAAPAKLQALIDAP